MSRKVKEARPISIIYDQFVENATGPWGTSTRSTSSQLYRRLNTRATFGSVSGTQELHLLLCLHLKEHENKDHEG
jgi:hypothetical protein